MTAQIGWRYKALKISAVEMMKLLTVFAIDVASLLERLCLYLLLIYQRRLFWSKDCNLDRDKILGPIRSEGKMIEDVLQNVFLSVHDYQLS